jgi:sugar lactone lactonase YvrE
VIPLDRFDELAGGLNHSEGAAWNPVDGFVYAGGEGGQLSITLEGDVAHVGSSGGSMLGIAVDGRGRVYACMRGTARSHDGIRELERCRPTLAASAGRDMDTPNLVAFAPEGTPYVTCSGEHGRPEILRVSPAVPTSNAGPTPSPAIRTARS